MFDNLTVLAIIIISVWVATLVFYFYMSRQQQQIREELNELKSLLEDREEQER